MLNSTATTTNNNKITIRINISTSYNILLYNNIMLKVFSYT